MVFFCVIAYSRFNEAEASLPRNAALDFFIVLRTARFNEAEASLPRNRRLPSSCMIWLISECCEHWILLSPRRPKTPLEDPHGFRHRLIL